MKLKYYTPTGHNLIIEYYEQKDQKIGSIFVPETRTNAQPMGLVLAVGPFCEGINEGDIVVLFSTEGLYEMNFEDHIGICYSVNHHSIIGVFKNERIRTAPSD